MEGQSQLGQVPAWFTELSCCPGSDVPNHALQGAVGSRYLPGAFALSQAHGSLLSLEILQH